MNNQARSWCFTIFSDELKAVRARIAESAICKRCCIGIETCPQTNKLHLQGVIEFTSPKRFKWVKRWLDEQGGNEPHVEKTKDWEASVIYCQKEDKDATKKNLKKNPGKRTDLTWIKQELQNGGSLQEVALKTKNIGELKYAEAISKYTGGRRAWRSQVFWLWGKTASGKSRWVHENFPDVWTSGLNLKWWQGYHGQNVVCFDDFRGEHCDYANLLKVLDRYPLIVENKGGSANLMAHTIIITAPYKPDLAYPEREHEQMDQLLRRIDWTFEVKKGRPIEMPEDYFPGRLMNDGRKIVWPPKQDEQEQEFKEGDVIDLCDTDGEDEEDGELRESDLEFICGEDDDDIEEPPRKRKKQ